MSEPIPATESSRVLIVGASAAGVATATSLRRRGYPGSIRMLGDEYLPPYDRPPLSKQFLDGSWDESKLNLAPDDRLGGLGIEFVPGFTAADLDLEARVVSDGHSRRESYDALVIATGLVPRRLPGFDGRRVHVLRTLADAVALRSQLISGASVLVVGGGFLGLEVAATATEQGAHVVLVEPMETSLDGKVGALAARRLYELHVHRGVDVRLGVGVAGPPALAGGSSHLTVRLTDGTAREFDAVVMAIGASPATDWLRGSGLVLEDGVVCDATCAAAPGVWAAGDVARWYHQGLGRLVRVEHRTNATEQGQAVAGAIMGDAQPYLPVPFFWTDQFDVRLQVAGVLPMGTEGLVAGGQSDGDSFLLHFLQGSELVGVLGWNAPREVASCRRELVSQAALRAAAGVECRP